jgi:hypothetical protein
MDADLVHQVLAYRRPGGPAELAPDDAAALECLLAERPALAALADRDARWDGAIRTAMAAVPAAAGLKERIVAAELARRATAGRRTVVRLAAAAAAVAVASTLSYGVFLRTRPALDGGVLAERASREREDPEGAVRAFLASRGLPARLPMGMDYLRCYEHAGTADLGGVTVPCVVFVANGPQRRETLRVYIVSRSQFRSHDLRPGGSSFSTVTFGDDPANGLTYVYESTSPTLDLFLLPPAPDL